MKIYPNPSSGLINVEAEEIESIVILDMLGKQIYFSRENEIDLRNEPKGNYIIKVKTDKVIAVAKIVIE